MERDVTIRLEFVKDHFMAVAMMIRGIDVRPSGPALAVRFEHLYEDLREGRAGGTEENRAALRDILRNGRFRPSGRSKPAQEYLSKVFSQHGRIELINNIVDINNFVSLRYGLPLSAFNGDTITGDVVIRLGRPEERYVFNASGQEMDCQDLVVVCDGRGPMGSPVKDSQSTKVFPGVTSVLFVVYASEATNTRATLHKIAIELGTLMVEDCPEADVGQPLFSERNS